MTIKKHNDLYFAYPLITTGMTEHTKVDSKVTEELLSNSVRKILFATPCSYIDEEHYSYTYFGLASVKDKSAEPSSSISGNILEPTISFMKTKEEVLIETYTPSRAHIVCFAKKDNLFHVGDTPLEYGYYYTVDGDDSVLTVDRQNVPAGTGLMFLIVHEGTIKLERVPIAAWKSLCRTEYVSEIEKF